MYMRKDIATSQETSLWFDPWSPAGNIVDQIGRSNCYVGENPN